MRQASHPAEVGRQPEASLAWSEGDLGTYQLTFNTDSGMTAKVSCTIDGLASPGR